MQEGEGEQQEEGLNLSRVYDISVGKYDVAVDTGPSFTTKREEAATQMVEMAHSTAVFICISGITLHQAIQAEIVISLGHLD